ncbi:metal-sensing transcriptional repressor [Pokkaliibacter sp. MBI-7]|uniref:metal-sensing transcriptional repressor n=1 Tax=Pokkaliibacter sp. MBI-7 TaxID=3040600 RepID=UPI0024479FDF|nr:metal-sensing transcriptional repressor [Pokkaliibacter sp. MBI-7]MDH2434665.1 metal-sensing transcriptional repressor [Pokkaliibacter sp. MBI-7]
MTHATESHPPLQESHPDIFKRLKRAEGHLRSIISMMQEQRSCADVVQQLHAVEKAVCQAKRTLIKDHVDHLLEHLVDGHGDQQEILAEFHQITRHL